MREPGGWRVEVGATTGEAGYQQADGQMGDELAGPRNEHGARGPAQKREVDAHGVSRRKWVVNVKVVGTGAPSRRAGLKRSCRAARRADSSNASSPLLRPTVIERTRPSASRETISRTSASTPAA